MTYLGDKAFFGTNIDRLVLPTSHSSIGKRAFQSCSSLTQVALPATVKSIGNNSFADCTQLKEISIPSSNKALTAIPSAVFSGCDNLQMVTLSSSIRTIGSSAFRGCPALTTVVMPNVKTIQPKAFDGDVNLNCIISQYQSFLTVSCPVELMNYSFSVNTVSGVLVANFANNLLKDYSKMEPLFHTINLLVLAADKQQFLQIKEFSSYTSELTLTFWFNAFSISSGTICDFSNETFSDTFRIYLSSGTLTFWSATFSHEIVGFVADIYESYHVAWVQAIQSSDDTVGYDWSFYLNGKALETVPIEGNCAVHGGMNVNYLGPTMTPTSPTVVAPSTLVLLTAIDGAITPLADAAIAGIEEFKMFSSSSPTGSIGAPSYRTPEIDLALNKLKALLNAGEKWRRCYHSETEHDEQCFVELWRSPLNGTVVTLMCTDCYPYKAITAETIPEKFEYERRRMDEDREKYDFEPRNSANRGLSIGFLVEFCRKFDLWKVPTWKVRRDYIIPMTKDFRCRFVDLPAMQESGIVELADIFISFSNATLFGDLIAAISDGADYRRRVWIDIFAVMQWPSARSDLHFDKVIRRSLSVCPSVEAVGRQKKISSISERFREDKKMIPYFRVWCLFEIFHAAILKKQQEGRNRSHFSDRFLSIDGSRLLCDDLYAVKEQDLEGQPLSQYSDKCLGSSVFGSRHILFKTSSCEFNQDGSHSLKVDKKMLSDLINYIDINKADATSEEDKKGILNQIETGYSSNGGVAGLNFSVEEVLTIDSDPILECAVRGESRAIEAIYSQPELYILNAVRGGLADLLKSMMKMNVQSVVEVSIYNRLDVAVEVYVVNYDGASLNYEVNAEKYKNAMHSMAEGSFWIARNLDDDDVGVYIATAAKKRWIIY
eukprot:gene32437-42025_t